MKKQIASIIQTKHNEITVKMEKVQQQNNSIEYGVYAITFATDLCHGLDPVNCLYIVMDIYHGLTFLNAYMKDVLDHSHQNQLYQKTFAAKNQNLL